MENLTVQESFNQRQSYRSIHFIDVVHLQNTILRAVGAINHPMESIDLNNFPFSKGDEVHVICQAGGRSMKACQKLEAAGF